MSFVDNSAEIAELLARCAGTSSNVTGRGAFHLEPIASRAIGARGWGGPVPSRVAVTIAPEGLATALPRQCARAVPELRRRPWRTTSSAGSNGGRVGLLCTQTK